MLRRVGTKMALLVAALVAVTLVFLYEGHQAAVKGQTLRQQLGSSYGQVVRDVGKMLDWQDPSAARILAPATTPTPSPTTSPPASLAWSNPLFAERRQRSENRCLKVKKGGVERLTRYGNVSYCVVPKVGCTFWLNVFRYLHNDTGSQRYPSPFHIPRMVTHYGPRKNMKYYFINTSFTPEHLVGDLRFMFVRDPYSRLWSAYVDKFLLVDYWHTEGQNIVRLRKSKNNFTRCARDISFPEFLDYVATRVKEPARLNEHWKPIQFQCSSCLYRPHVIGKMETFSRDVRYVLKLLNMTWMLDNYDHEAHVHGEMDMLIDYNYRKLSGHSKFFSTCTSTADLAQRLWRTFQINGYLPSETPFPEPGAAHVNISQFKKLAHAAYSNRPAKSPREWRAQRQQAMVDAYRGVSKETLAKLQDIYKYDFEIFDYDPAPVKLFGDRTS